MLQWFRILDNAIGSNDWFKGLGDLWQPEVSNQNRFWYFWSLFICQSPPSLPGMVSFLVLLSYSPYLNDGTILAI